VVIWLNQCRGCDIIPSLPATETIVTGTKVATAIDHLKNNRIEYLVLLLFSHVLGFTDILISRAAGVCY